MYRVEFLHRFYRNPTLFSYVFNRSNKDAAWHVKPDSFEYVTRLSDESKLLVPTGWTSLPGYIGQASGWKIAECIRFLGDQGLYILGLLIFNDVEIKKVFMDMVQTLNLMLEYDNDDRQLRGYHAQLVVVLSKLEGLYNSCRIPTPYK